MILPFLTVLWLAVYSGKFVRGVADFLAAGRVAGRYVIAVGDVASGLSVITLVALVEAKYQCGYGMSFWETLMLPISTVLSLSGYCIYRYRATRALSIGQFLEMRYSRSFRVVAATIRTIAEMITNSIGPAVAANFFIYFLGLPHKFNVCGVNLPTFVLLTGSLLVVATIVLWPGGRISLLITDCFQSLLSYPVFVVLVGYVFLKFNWGTDIAPVMMDRAPGESYINPYDVSQLRDFNIFALAVNITNSVLNRASWIGNDTTGAGRTPHEQKMANILGTWRNGFAIVMQMVIALMIICLMSHARFADQARDIRVELSNKVLGEVIEDVSSRDKISAALSAIPVQRHRIGIDAPLSRAKNLDTPYLDTALREMRAANAAKVDNKLEGEAKAAAQSEATAQANSLFQNFRSLYHQMMMPIALRNIFPVGLMGVFALLMIMLLISTDDSRIFNASSTIVQDMILPFLKNPPDPKKHLLMLRVASIAVAIFFFVVAVFFTQLDYINMFTTIMCSLWLGGAGPIMIGGLYSRFGNTVGAYCSLVFGSGISLAGLLCQRNWADHLYPWLQSKGWDVPVGKFLAAASSPLEPIVVWRMDAVKFPINSYEISMIAMIAGIIAYIIGSLVTYRKPYNLDRLLHRGVYALEGEKEEKVAWSFKTMWSKLIGITPEYTLGDRVIAWSVFTYNIIYKLFLSFIVVMIWNKISPWPKEWWSTYFYIVMLVIPSLAGVVTTVWFMTGGIIHLRQLFRDLAKRIDNPLDNGQVEGHVSLADRARLGEELSKE
jgi:Na+/proline symporter